MNKLTDSVQTKKLLLIISTLLLIFFITIYIFIFNYYKTSLASSDETKIQQLENAYRSTTSAYQNLADIIFETSVNTDRIVKLYKQCVSAESSTDSNRYRQQLLNELTPIYSLLQEYSFRQLHFHDKKNISFLRFHRPEKFGDDLTGIRYSVEYVNREQKKIAGFEEGRIFNGYRYVYPLSYDNQHTGSVEVSISVKTILDQIENTLNMDAQFILLREQMEKKVFESELSNYIPWSADERFVLDIGISEHCILENNISDKDRTKLQEAVSANISSGEAFTVDVKFTEKNSTVTFLPVTNFLNENIAYILSISDNSRNTGITHSFRIATVIYFLFLSMIIFLTWFYMSTRKSMDRLMRTDQLTNIDTRRILLEKIDNENIRFSRYQRPYSIIMIDIDHFKTINDTYGHLAGDEVLKNLTNLIKSNIRTADTFGRYGGEEFIIMLPETRLDEAVCVAENLRKAVENAELCKSQKVTISLGVAEVFIDVKNIEELIDLADKNLYRAKDSGRNRVCY